MKLVDCSRAFAPFAAARKKRLCAARPPVDIRAAPTPRKTLVFDFDGVLANSIEVTLEIVRDIARDQKVAPLTPQEYHSLTMAQLKRRLKVRFYQVPGLIRRGRAYAHANRARMRAHTEVLPLLAWARSQNLSLTILSSNSPPTIQAFLARNMPDVQFTEIVGNVGMYSKDRAIKRLMERRGLECGQLMYIGDEVRDVEAANAAGIACTAVLWGKDKYESLAQARPTHYAANSADVIEAVRHTLKP